MRCVNHITENKKVGIPHFQKPFLRASAPLATNVQKNCTQAKQLLEHPINSLILFDMALDHLVLDLLNLSPTVGGRDGRAPGFRLIALEHKRDTNNAPDQAKRQPQYDQKKNIFHQYGQPF
jgi:hypothetical protein